MGLERHSSRPSPTPPFPRCLGSTVPRLFPSSQPGLAVLKLEEATQSLATFPAIEAGLEFFEVARDTTTRCTDHRAEFLSCKGRALEPAASQRPRQHHLSE